MKSSAAIPWFYRPELLNRDGFPWSADVSARAAFLSGDVTDRLDLAGYSRARYEETMKRLPEASGESPEEARRRAVGYLNIKWFMQTLLDRMDRTSMYSGLEARVPFADHRIMEYVFNVPWSMKYQNGVEKTLLRDACADLLPAELLHRKKSPYPKTYHPGYEKISWITCAGYISDPNAPVYPLIDPKKAKAFLAAPKELGRPWFGAASWRDPSLWHILSSSMTGWENIICPCKEKKTPPESCPPNMRKADTTVDFLPPGG